MAPTFTRLLLAVSLALATPLALAQTGDTTTTRTEVRDDRGFDLGWLGLLGLIGLAGLRRREDHRGPGRTHDAMR